MHFFRSTFVSLCLFFLSSVSSFGSVSVSVLEGSAPSLPDLSYESSFLDSMKISPSDAGVIAGGLDGGDLGESVKGLLGVRLQAAADAFVDSQTGMIEDRFERSALVSSLHLEWKSPLAGRKHFFQFDTVIAPIDSEHWTFMVQSGAQLRDVKPAFYGGGVLRANFEGWFVPGVNFFYDYLDDLGKHHRFSWGGEIKTRYLDFYANRYWSVGKKRGNYLPASADMRRQYVFSPDGWDTGVVAQFDYVPWFDVEARYYRWKIPVREGDLVDTVGNGGDLEGVLFRFGLSPFPLLKFNVRYDRPDRRQAEDWGVGVSLNYDTSKTLLEHVTLYRFGGESASPWSRRHERVRREYEQRIQSLEDFGKINIARLLTPGENLTAVNITGWWPTELSESEHLANIIDGLKRTTGNCRPPAGEDNCDNQIIPNTSNGQPTAIIFDWSSIGTYHQGEFLFYNRTKPPPNFRQLINGSTVEFFLDNTKVAESTLAQGGENTILSVTPNPEVRFNKIVLTFSGALQSFREIEVLATPVLAAPPPPDTVDGV